MSLVDLKQAVKLLIAGELVAIPTETVYGLAGRIDHEDTLKNIFYTKSRPFFDPLIVHVSGVEQVRDLVTDWPDIYAELAKEFWPGPLTLIAPKSAAVSPLITSGLESVGLRCPNHPLALELLREIQTPLAAPSANRFGRTSPTKAEHVIQEFDDRVAVLDGGPCSVGVESTVLQGEWQAELKSWDFQILRPGGITSQELSQFLNHQKLSFTLKTAASQASPGHLKAHYQPRSPVVILNNGTWSNGHLGKISEKLGQPVRSAKVLKLPSDAAVAARVLYQEFRNLSGSEDQIIVVERSFLPGKDHQDFYQGWEAIWDRLTRAASLEI